jgi:UDP-glucose 4-epimerase
MNKNRAVKGSISTASGGTGSFGSTMAKHFLERDAAEVRIISLDEAKQDAMRHAFADPRVRFYLGDTRGPKSVERVVRGTNLIFTLRP